MDGSQFDAIAADLYRSRRTLLGSVVAAAGVALGTASAANKKKKKKCKAPTTKCGKKACCQPGQVCSGGKCQTAVTPPTPLTPFQCPGPRDGTGAGPRRFAQTFVANGSGTIGSATFEVSEIEADMAFGVEIRTTQNGAPTSVTLGTAIIFNPPPTPQPTPLTATFAPKVPVTGGVTYALVITDLANKGFTISTRTEGVCPTELFIDINANNQFFSFDGSLVYAINP